LSKPIPIDKIEKKINEIAENTGHGEVKIIVQDKKVYRIDKTEIERIKNDK